MGVVSPGLKQAVNYPLAFFSFRSTTIKTSRSLGLHIRILSHFARHETAQAVYFKNKDQLWQYLRAPMDAPSSLLSTDSLSGLSNLPANQLITPTIGN